MITPCDFVDRLKSWNLLVQHNKQFQRTILLNSFYLTILNGHTKILSTDSKVRIPQYNIIYTVPQESNAQYLSLKCSLWDCTHGLKKFEPVSYTNHHKQEHRKVVLIDLYKNSNTIGFLDRVRCTSLKNRLKNT